MCYVSHIAVRLHDTVEMDSQDSSSILSDATIWESSISISGSDCEDGVRGRTFDVIVGSAGGSRWGELGVQRSTVIEVIPVQIL